MKKIDFDAEILKKFYGNTDFGFCIFNGKQEIIFCNKKLSEMARLTEKAIESTSIKKLFNSKSLLKRITDAIESNGTIYDCNFEQGDDVKFNLHFESFDANFSLAFFYDISEISRLKKELIINEKRTSIAQKAADIGSWEYDYKTGMLFFSEKSNEIFGKSGFETLITFERVLEFVQDKEKVKKDFYDFIEGDIPYDTVYKINTSDGTGERVIYSYGSKFKDNSGQPIKAVGYVKNITPWIQLEETVRYEENLVDTYLNIVRTIVVMLDSEGKVTFLNKMGSEILGYSQDEFIGTDWIKTTIPEHERERIVNVWRDTYTEKADFSSVVENNVITSTGEKRIIRWTNSVIRNKKGEITGTISSGDDITNIRQSQQKLEENTKSFKRAEIVAKMGHWIRNIHDNTIIWSEGLYQMFGYEPGELPASKEISLNVLVEEDRPIFINAIEKAMEYGEGYNINVRGRRKNGDIIHITIEADVKIDENGKTNSIYGIVIDNTNLYNRIMELKSSIRRLDLSESISHTGHWQRDLSSDTYIFSKELYRIFGIDEGVELITHELLHERFYPDDRQRVQEFTENKLKAGEDYSFEARILKPDGVITYIEARVIIENDSMGKPVRANGIMRDVTELRIHERKLEQRELQLKKAEEIAGSGNWVMDIESGSYVCSDNFYRICGFDPESTETKFETIISVTHPEDIERINKIIEKSMKIGSDYEFENRLILPDGSIKHVRSRGTYIKDKDGKPIKSVGTLLDITEYKETEDRLRTAGKRLEKAEEISHVGHWERDYKLNTSYWSDEIYRILGVAPQSFVASEARYAEFIHPEDFAEFGRKANLAHEGKIPYLIEARIIRKNGELKHIRINGNVVKEGNKIIRTFGTLEDITEEKLREEELLEKNRLLDAAEEAAHVGHFINDNVKKTRYWSDEMFRILGYEPQADIDKRTLFKRNMDPEEYKLSDKEFLNAIENRKDSFEINLSIKDSYGNPKYLKLLYRFQYENDVHVTTFGVVKDMTEIKSHYEDMEYMNYHDSLTDLFNRRYFDENYSEIDVPGNYPLSIIVADINGLKMTNDTIGHDAGDRLIIKAARVLRSVCEEDDLLARIGGDDFILVMPATTQSQAESVMNDLYELFVKANEEVYISVSMGLAVKLKDDLTKKELLKNAEDNMYTSKLYEKTSKRGDLLRLIMDTLYERSSREEEHSERVSKYCNEMAKALNMPKHKVNELTALGLLHDIGKIAVKDSVLNKPGKLNDEEWAEIKRHSETGHRILSQSPGMVQASKYVLAHHERWDGKGYPNGLKTYEIPTQARIISICDAFDAMRSKRPYREPMPLDDAITQIREGAGVQFDPELAKVFVVQVLGADW